MSELCELYLTGLLFCIRSAYASRTKLIKNARTFVYRRTLLSRPRTESIIELGRFHYPVRDGKEWVMAELNAGKQKFWRIALQPARKRTEIKKQNYDLLVLLG